VPFPAVLESAGKLKPKEQLLQVFAEAGVQLEQPLVASCGSGLTACILALAVHEASGQLVRLPMLSVYPNSPYGGVILV
jgi:thiosulfate/3-mercaptopyruvate sulfurtransferase